MDVLKFTCPMGHWSFGAAALKKEVLSYIWTLQFSFFAGGAVLAGLPFNLLASKIMYAGKNHYCRVYM